MNDISRPAEVRDHGDSAATESFEDYAGTVVAQGRKHKHIGRSQALQDLGMAEPAGEGNSPVDSNGSHKLFEAAPLRAVANHGKAGQTTAQEGSGRAQSKVACLPGNQSANKNRSEERRVGK